MATNKQPLLPAVQFLRGGLSQPVDILPLAAFRIAFGALMCLGSLRIMWHGWVYAIYIQPAFHFSYFGFDFARPLPGVGMHLVFVALAGLALCIMLGWRYRLCMPAFFLLFTYVELLDQATYLNHYYFISLVSFLLCFMPAQGALSLDARRDAGLRRRTVPRWCIACLQLQLVIVYFFAGLAKLNGDWLLLGMPMRLWLRAHSDFPLLGQLFDQEAVALLFSWSGAFYDLTISLWLLWHKSRPFAWIAVAVFHLMTALLFPIGMFPWLMVGASLVFFTGKDFRWLAGALRRKSPAIRPAKSAVIPFRLPTLAKLTLALFFLIQLSLPLRHFFYPGDVNWTMEGYRFAWRVMLNEKAGFATFRVVDHTLGSTQIVFASQHLTEQQARHMAYQPDMIWQFAQYLGSQHAFHSQHDIAVYAEVWVAHNGAPARLLIDPRQNLLAVPRDLLAAEWILR